MSQPDEAHDLQLLRQAGGGNRRAFDGLVERHADRMFRMAMSLVGNTADAEDVLQEAWIGAFRSVGAFRGGASVKTWLTRILILQAAKWRRDRRPTGGRTEAIADDLPAKASGGVGVAMDLQAALQQLSEEHRAVLILREFEGSTYDEMAEALGVPRGTVESRLHRARGELREKLKSYQY